MITKGKWENHGHAIYQGERLIAASFDDFAPEFYGKSPYWDMQKNLVSEEEAAWNAQAIAALPDLIEALQATLTCLTTGLCENCSINCPENSNLAIEKAKAALKRAGMLKEPQRGQRRL